MLILLPLLTFLSLFLGMSARREPGDDPQPDWRHAFLQAALVWGALVVLFSEGLSLFQALTRAWLALLWAIALGVSLWWVWRNGGFARGWIRSLYHRPALPGLVDSVLIAGLVGIALTLLVVAWVSPPNNTDSLLYHMARVTHWAQSGSLRHYPTAFEPQLVQPTFAEMTILDLRLLWGNDQQANLVQWFSMVASTIGVSALAGLLGAGRKGQLLAACYAVSLPIGILEATSTQNDYVTAFWLVCLAYFVLLGRQRRLLATEHLSLALALGLGLLTKFTFYAYAIPFVAWHLVPMSWRHGLSRSIRLAISLGGVVVLLNFGYWYRNLTTYGAPLGTFGWHGGAGYRSLAPNRIVSSWIRDFALNLPTPSETLNQKLALIVDSIDDVLGMERGTFHIAWLWNHEDLSPNPIHLALAVIAMGALLATRRRGGLSLTRRYALVTLGSVLVLFVVLPFDVYGVRYQVPFFVVWAPVVGSLVTWVAKDRLAAALSALLLLLSLPWVLLNNTRPIVGLRPRTSIESIFTATPPEILFANWTSLRDPYETATAAVRASACRDVGLRIDSHDLEYPFWWLLEAPQSGIRVENIDPYQHLERYVDPSFRPCVIICTVCGSRTRFHGLEREGVYGGILLFSGLGYTADEDG